jgi:hypothetical protein
MPVLKQGNFLFSIKWNTQGQPKFVLRNNPQIQAGYMSQLKREIKIVSENRLKTGDPIAIYTNFVIL